LESFDRSPFLAIEGSGVLLNPSITAAQYAILEGFGSGGAHRYLTHEEITAAMSADSFEYRASPDNRSRQWSA
jgi:hypothetical protein